MMDRITDPGIYNIDEAAYHRDPCPDPSLSRTTAHVLLTQTAAHAAHGHPRIGPPAPSKESAAFDLGAAFHSHYLHAGKLSEVAVDDKGIAYDSWRTAAAQTCKSAIRATGKIPLLEHEHEQVRAMCAAAHDFVTAHPTLSHLFVGGVAERTVVWRETTKFGPIWCRAMVDWMNDDTAPSTVIDLKTAATADPREFEYSAVRHGYQLQAAFYRRGIRAAAGCDPRFLFLVVEKTAPHLACAFESDWGEEADEMVETAIQRWAWCLHNNNFPGYPTAVVPIRPTRQWQLKQVDRAETVASIEELPAEQRGQVLPWLAPEMAPVQVPMPDLGEIVP